MLGLVKIYDSVRKRWFYVLGTEVAQGPEAITIFSDEGRYQSFDRPRYQLREAEVLEALNK